MPPAVAADPADTTAARPRPRAIRAAIRLAGGREVCFVCHARRERRRADGARRRARRRPRACSRCPASRSARRDARAQPPVGTPRAVGPGPARSRRASTTTASASRSSTTTRRSSTSSSRCRRAPSSRALDADGDRPRPRSRRRDRRAASRATRIVRASARWPSRSRGSTTTAASACSRRERASANRSAISCRRCVGRRRTASARSCRRTRSTCRSSSSARICRFSSARSPTRRVRFALLKGWRNYLCLVRLEQARVVGQRAVRGRRATTSSTRFARGRSGRATAR